MNWNAIGAIAELLGAIGVIASLVYLATQIRQSREQMGQNTRAMQASTFQQFDQTLHDAFSNLLSAPGAARAFRRGLPSIRNSTRTSAGSLGPGSQAC